LLDSVTHEFRTPLTAIKLSVTTLLGLQIPSAAEARHDLLTVINEESRPPQSAGGRGRRDGAARRAPGGVAP
jgi:K+-sensing histidine kinase KdpD